MELRLNNQIHNYYPRSSNSLFSGTNNIMNFVCLQGLKFMSRSALTMRST